MAFVQAKSNGVGTNTFATSIAVTISAVGSGNLIAGGVTWGGPNGGSAATTDLTSVTDDKGNTYTIVRRILDAGNNQAAASFYGKNLTGGPTVITANFSTSAETRGITLQEHSGLDTSAPLDGTNEQGQNQASPGTGTDGAKSGAGTQTPSANNCTVVGFSVDTGALNGAGGSEFTAGTNFTEPANAEWSVTNDISFSSEYWIQTTATAVNASYTLAANNAHTTFQMVFKTAAGSGTSITPNAGSLALTGQSAVKVVATTIAPSAGALNFTGQQPQQQLSVPAPLAGSLALSGNTPQIVLGTVVTPAVASLVVSGQSLIQGISITPSTGAAALSGQTPQIQNGGSVSLSPSAGSLVLTGQQSQITVPADVTIVPSVGTLSFAGTQPTISGPVLIRPSTGVMSIGGQQVLMDGMIGLSYRGFRGPSLRHYT